MTTQPMDWAQALHTRIAAAIRAARGDRSAQELADATKHLGYPISRSQIANYETGRKHSLDVAELMILAAALGIPPSLLLLFPNFPDGAVELLPGREVRAEAALRWLSGDAPLPVEVDGTVMIGPDNAGTRLVDAVFDRATVESELAALLAAEERFRGTERDTEASREYTQRTVADRRARLARIDIEIRKSKAQLWGTDDERATNG